MISCRTGQPWLNNAPPPHPPPLFQESISDFYWYYSGKDVIDEQGQRNFSKAIQVAKQVFNTLTEYIQVNIYPLLLFGKRKKTGANRLPWNPMGKGNMIKALSCHRPIAD